MTTATISQRAGVLGQSEFRLVFVGQLLSTLGDAAATIAVAFAVLELGGSASALGAVLAARYLPLAAFLLISGAVADRVPRRRLMLASDVLRAVTQGILAVLFLTGTAQLWEVIVLQVVYGTAEAFFSPALSGLLPQLVSGDRLQSANALLRMTFDLSVVIGPSLGAVLVAQYAAGSAVAADAATFAVSALLLLRLRAGRQCSREPTRVSFGADLRDGWREVRSRRWLWLSIGNTTLFSALAMPAILVLGPELARRELGGIGAWAILVGAFGGGALAGSIVSLRLRSPRPAAAIAVLVALAAARPAVFTSGLGLPLIATFSFAAGAAMSTASILWITLLQQRIPAAAISRVYAIDSFGMVLLMPVGYLMAGPLAASIGLHEAMLLLAVLPLLLSLATLASSQVRNVGWIQASSHPPGRERKQRSLAAEPLVDERPARTVLALGTSPEHALVSERRT
jgi:MFS family permease